MGRFEKFYGGATKSGKKVLGSIHPELKAASTKDKFVLNPVALKLLDIKPGVDRVMLFDHVADATSNNDRFFICKGGVDADGVKHGSLVGKNGVFSYSEIWSAFHMQDMAVTAARPDDMVDKGIVIRTPVVQAKDDEGNLKFDPKTKEPIMTGGAYIANQLVLGKLEIAVDEVDGEEVEARGVEVEKGLYADVFMVTNFRIVPHDPQVADEDEIETEPGDEPGKGKKGKKAKADEAEA